MLGALAPWVKAIPMCVPEKPPRLWQHTVKGCVHTVFLNGYQLGKTGAAMPEFCAADQMNAFRSAYLEGLELYERISDFQVKLNQIDRDIQRNNMKGRHELNMDIQAYERQLAQGTGNHGEVLSSQAILNINAMILQASQIQNHP